MDCAPEFFNENARFCDCSEDEMQEYSCKQSKKNNVRNEVYLR